MINFLLSGIFLLLAISPVLAQETGADENDTNNKDVLYITDQLRLSLYQQADAQSKVLELLGSGDKLAVEQISGQYALVTTGNGKKGWVKRGFLVSKPTANLLLIGEQDKNKKLSEELEKLASSRQIIDQYEQEVEKLNQSLATTIAEKEQAVAKVDHLEQVVLENQKDVEIVESERVQREIPVIVLMSSAATYWEYILALALSLFLLGFLLAKKLVESRIKRRFQGIKVW